LIFDTYRKMIQIKVVKLFKMNNFCNLKFSTKCQGHALGQFIGDIRWKVDLMPDSLTLVLCGELQIATVVHLNTGDNFCLSHFVLHVKGQELVHTFNNIVYIQQLLFLELNTATINVSRFIHAKLRHFQHPQQQEVREILASVVNVKTKTPLLK